MKILKMFWGFCIALGFFTSTVVTLSFVMGLIVVTVVG
jgi:hypothetical protein